MRMTYNQALEKAEWLCKIHGLDFTYLTADHPDCAFFDIANDSGWCGGDSVVVGECSRPELIVEIAAHEVGHHAIAEWQKKLHTSVFAGDYEARHRTVEWCSIIFSIPVERAAWVYGWHLLQLLGTGMSFKGFLFMLKCLYGYRICNGGNIYRYERMSWFARRRVDLRALMAIVFEPECPVKYKYGGPVTERARKLNPAQHELEG